jgi:hypothetical protein
VVAMGEGEDTIILTPDEKEQILKEVEEMEEDENEGDKDENS